MDTQQDLKIPVSVEEAVELGAVDQSFFNEFFFPRAFPLPSPAFHRDIDQIFDAPGRLKAVKSFRGSAKTTKFRAFSARRIAYGFSRLSLVVSETQGHSIKTLDWLKRRIEEQKLYAKTFDLVPGDKWSESEIEIKNNKYGTVHRILALGLYGQVRGFNFDDERPDTILLDDPLDEENTATPEARNKSESLIMGALVNGLAAPGVSPDAQLIFGQTPLNPEDGIMKACADPGWVTGSFSCFNPDGSSRWPELFPTEYLQKAKAEAISRNQLSIWLREMECILTSRESAAFRREWLDITPAIPSEGFNFICIDPTPPPTPGEVARKTPYRTGLDDFVIMACRVWNQEIFILEVRTFKSPLPTQVTSVLFEMVLRYHPLWVAIETILFARTLAYNLQEEMVKTGLFFTILPVEDKRAKPIRIRQALTRRASNRRLHCHPAMAEFIEQFSTWPDSAHDDILDALSIGLTALNPALEGAAVGNVTASPGQQTKKRGDTPWRSAP